MKKLLVVLMTCAVVTGAFASCGSKEKEESSEKKTDTSVSDSAEEDTTVEETTTEEVVEETESTETEIEESEKSTDSENSESITGMWLVDYESYGFYAYENGSGSIVLDVSQIVHIQSDGSLYLSGETVNAEDVVYDAGLLTVTIDGSEMTLEKDDTNLDKIDGRYYITDIGNFNDANIMGVISDMGIESPDPAVYIEGDKIYLEFENMFTYTAKDGNITVSEDFDAIALYKDSVITYEFTDDDHVNIVTDGYNRTMTRINL